MTRKVVLLGLAVLLLASGGGVWLHLRPENSARQTRNMLEQATNFLAQGNFREASLCARQVVQREPSNLDALQFMAELAGRADSPLALEWWRRIVEVCPSQSNKLSFAAAAMRHEGPPYASARQLLKELQSTSPLPAAYHLLSAEVAFRLGEHEKAAVHYQAALEIEPTNELHRLNYALMQLQSITPGDVAEGRKQLQELQKNPVLNRAAFRWLIVDALRNQQLDTAERLSHQLANHPEAIWEDHLQRLSVLRLYEDDRFRLPLQELQRKAATNSADIFTLASWMIRQSLATETIRWLETIPAFVAEELPAPLAWVEVFVHQADWVKLQALLLKQEWEELDWLRLAYLSRAAAELHQTLAAENYWRRAVRSAGEQFGTSLALSRLARAWGRNGDYEELLWRIVEKFPRERWVFGELDHWYTSKGNTRGLYRLYSAIARHQPTNSISLNNLASLAFLLGKDLARAHQLVQKAYSQSPQHPTIATTYAYSLYLQGRTEDALRILENVMADAPMDGQLSLYQGVILSAAGKQELAARCLEAASKLELLPEEQQLLVGVRSKEGE